MLCCMEKWREEEDGQQGDKHAESVCVREKRGRENVWTIRVSAEIFPLWQYSLLVIAVINLPIHVNAA